MVEIEDKNGATVPIRALLDTGTTSSIVLREFVKKGRAKSYKGKRTSWSTLGGTFSTNRKALLDFSFPEKSHNKKVTHVCHVDDKTSRDKANYDMIIGMDLMTEIGIYVNTATKVIHWEGTEIPLKECGMLTNREHLQNLHNMYQSSYNTTLLEAEKHQSHILDANYSAVDIGEYVESLTHLNIQERALLKQTLLTHTTLF